MKNFKQLFSILFAILFTQNVIALEALEQAEQYYGKKKYQSAYQTYLPLAKAGNILAQTQLAKMYMFGQGVGRDYKQAAYWLSQANISHDPEAAFLYAKLLLNGKGVAKSTDEAVKWFKQSANAGFVDAQHALGVMFIQGIGVQQDYKQAVMWNKQAAEGGNAEAAYNLARLHEAGAGVDQSERKAHEWYEKSAKLGHTLSQFELGKRYLKSQATINDQITKANYSFAADWLSKAAQKGHVPAQFELARLYKDARANMPDYPQSKQWYTSVLNAVYGQKNQMAYESAFFLGGIHQFGLGAEVDLIKAYMYYSLALDGTDAKVDTSVATKVGSNDIGTVRDNLKVLKEKFTKAELAQAEETLKAWKAKHR